ncbi:glycosyl transferase family 2 [Marinobacterium aestuarii]|uniref:Glycosyl transferase family 2 n=2 Tax=Marinobacterium aestuarii TaxID=1821621 RepID=A0A1A9F479_9GAMM|nr:glycosyl transferase family 2 [Marinobacterium aestuarii]
MTNDQAIAASDLIDNPSPRCACMVVLDTSGSMSGQPIRELNDGLQRFLESLNRNEVAACSVEVGVITAGQQVDVVLPFVSAMNVDGFQRFDASGPTPLGAAVELALDTLEKRKGEYRKTGVAYYQPWLVVISDGAPTDHWQSAAQRAKTLSGNRKMVALAVGVQGADMQVLGEFSNRPAIPLDGLKFGEFFEWLSASMSRVSASASTASRVDLPPMDSWANI